VEYQRAIGEIAPREIAGGGAPVHRNEKAAPPAGGLAPDVSIAASKSRITCSVALLPAQQDLRSEIGNVAAGRNDHVTAVAAPPLNQPSDRWPYRSPVRAVDIRSN
jgi:hypothetical protein